MHIALTGAATGIGAAALALFKANGHRVTAFDRVPVPDADTWVAVDLADLDAVRAAAGGVAEPVDALVLNAGVPPRPDNQAALLTINVLASIAFAGAIEQQLTPGAGIVVTASRAGEKWQENIAQVQALLAIDAAEDVPAFLAQNPMDPLRAYCLSKEAMIVWAMCATERLLARELRVNCVSPSAVETPILGDFLDYMGARAKVATDRVGRAGQPEDVAQIIAFLAGPASAWIRGQNIVCDGGISAMVASDGL